MDNLDWIYVILIGISLVLSYVEYKTKSKLALVIGAVSLVGVWYLNGSLWAVIVLGVISLLIYQPWRKIKYNKPDKIEYIDPTPKRILEVKERLKELGTNIKPYHVKELRQTFTERECQIAISKYIKEQRDSGKIKW